MNLMLFQGLNNMTDETLPLAHACTFVESPDQNIQPRHRGVNTSISNSALRFKYMCHSLHLSQLIMLSYKTGKLLYSQYLNYI